MKILFIGGNGNISWYCVEVALSQGHEVWALNRDCSSKTRRVFNPKVKRIIGDINNCEIVIKQLENQYFDAVCDFICYNAQEAYARMKIFKNITNQYILISSEAVYERFVGCLPFNEKSKKYSAVNVHGYIKGKIEAENLLINAYEKEKFPLTIVRPGYTYDTIMPVSLGYNCYTVAENIINNRILYVSGDGNNYWNPLHSSDFAQAFMYIIGNKISIGNVYNIAGSKLISLNDMAYSLISALNLSNVEIVNLSISELRNNGIIKDDEIAYQHSLDYDFDLSEIKKIAADWKQKIFFKEGIRLTIKWFDEDNVRKRINNDLKCKLEILNHKYKRGI